MGELNRRFPLYRRALLLYPAGYRSDYGGEMLQTLADMLDDTNSGTGRAGVWARAIIDLPISAFKQQLILAGGVMAHEMPNYIKQRALIGLGLIAPFLTFLILDSITSHSLYGSFFWRPWVVLVWLIILPTLALGISTATLARWLIEQRRQRISYWRSLKDWRRSWPLLLVAGAGLSILLLAFFHDSVHCVVHNPIPEIRYWHTTWTCLRNG